MLVILWRISLYLTYNLSNMFRTESTMLFATQSANSRSTSMGYVDLQPSLLMGVLLISSTWKCSLRAGLTVHSSSTCAAAPKWSQMVARIPYPVTVPSTTRSLVKWSLCTYSVPLGSLFPRYTDTRLSRTTRLNRVYHHGVRPRHQVKRRMV